MHTARLLILAPALAGIACAQAVVVPAARLATDGTSGGALAGVEQRFRMQALLDGSALAPLAGQSVTSLAFRRDGQHRGAQQGGRVHLTVRLSTSTRSSAEASAVFANNHGADVRQVFAGEVAIPASPPLATRDSATWTAPDAIVITLRDPFAYAAGTLCIDLEGSPIAGAASPWWRIDYELFGHDARIASSGASCDPFSNAFAARNRLLPAGSLDLLATGPRNASAVLLVGTNPLIPAVGLDFLGATGCEAGVLPAATVASLIASGPPSGYAAANLTLQLPGATAIAGARLYAQWAVFPNPGNAALLTTTNVLELNVASSLSLLPGALVRTGPLSAAEPWPAWGRVHPQLVPVVRLGYQ